MRTVRDLRDTPVLRRLTKLIDAIAAMPMDLTEEGPVPIEILLWDGRRIEGAYHKCAEEDLDVVDKHDIITDDDALRPFVEALLATEEPFVTETGESDMVCTLQWSIH